MDVDSLFYGIIHIFWHYFRRREGLWFLFLCVLIIPLFNPSRIYSTYASRVKQMTETDNSCIIKHNRVKNPNWPQANQLAIYKRGRGFEHWTTVDIDYPWAGTQ